MMDNPNKNKANSFEKFLYYFKDLLTKEEKHTFEKEMMLDPFEEEAYEGLSRLDPEDLKKDLYELQDIIESRTRKKKLVLLPVFRYAAAAILILALGTTVLLIRKSVEQVPTFQDFVQAEDSSLFETKPLQKSEDTLKKNFAFTKHAEKEETQIQLQKHSAPAKETEVTTQKKEPVLEKEKTVVDETEVSTEENLIAMDEVVVVGYGTMKKSDLSGAIIPIPSEDLSEGEPLSETLQIEQTLQGKVAGVQIEPGGSPGSDADIQIRGAASLRRDKAKSSEISLSSGYTDLASEDSRMIAGTVVSSALGEPLPGVNVMVKGTNTGTVTDMHGNFALEVPAVGGAVLAFNYIGFEGEEIEIPHINTINLTMSESMLALDEVVVIGYGTQGESSMEASPPVIVKPKPAIGLRRFKDYIQENINYTVLPEFEKSVVVILKFTIARSGDILNITIEKSAGEAFDEEAIRLLTEGPKWTAGTVDGVSAEDEVTLKIKFTPPQEP